MTKRIPGPQYPAHSQIVLSAEEMQAVKGVAHPCRLSVADFLRAVVESMCHPEQTIERRNVVIELSGASEAEQASRPTE